MMQERLLSALRFVIPVLEESRFKNINADHGNS